MAEATSIAPRKALLLMEGRAIPELFGFAAALPTLSLLAPRGDGQPVLVLPGLTTNDTSTIAMRRFLKSKGYPTYGWKMGLNLGPRPGVERGLIDLVEGLHEEHGRKVSIVGWSLGGIYARQLGKMMPDKIRQVISMGSPFGGSPRATNAWRVYEMASGQSSHDGERHMGGAISAPPPVPTTAIYSKTDGVCAWQNCIEAHSEIAENIEVKGSHCGLGHHPAAVYAVADRLAQPEGDWQHFDRSGFKSVLYPEPVYPH
ncbi:esterase/lipase family protein [Sulfitobacter aestuariivivens]|nr:alpha/beta hydrolase [Sulfitobacter aestuariivivens]